MGLPPVFTYDAIDKFFQKAAPHVLRAHKKIMMSYPGFGGLFVDFRNVFDQSFYHRVLATCFGLCRSLARRVCDRIGITFDPAFYIVGVRNGVIDIRKARKIADRYPEYLM